MRKNNLSPAVVIALLAIGAALLATQFKGGLDGRLAVNLYGDFTSSGGSRHYNASLVFDGDELVSGWQRYESLPGGGGHTVIECVVDVGSLSWVDKETRGECGYILDYIPLDKNELLEKINSGEFKPAESCGHLDICYDIVE